MLIWNGKELPSNYTISDDMIIEINSTIPENELYDILRKGGDIDPDAVSIHTYINGNGRVRLESDNMPEKSSIYEDDKEVLIGKSVNLAEDKVFALNIKKGKDTPVREPIFKAFESYMFGNEFEGYNIKPFVFDIYNRQHLEILRRHLALAFGIQPNIYSHKDDKGVFDISFDDSVRLSKAGKLLYRDFGKGSVGVDNPLPEISDIDYLSSLNEYEKRLIARNTVHPARCIELKRALETASGKGAVLSEDLYTALVTEDIKNIVSSRLSGVTEELLSQYRDAFQEEFHFVPQILSEYVKGLLLADDKRDIKEQVKAFNRNSVSAPYFTYTDPESGKEKKVTVAFTRNPALIYLSSKLNFAEIPAQLIRAMSVYINASNIRRLEEKGLSDWIKANKNTSVADFIQMLENEDVIKSFDPSYSAKQLSNYLDTALGDRDRKLFENMYNYKFSDNEIAIRGRHLVVKQGNITIRMLPANDLKNFVTGYDTCCCQRWDDGDYHKGGKNYKKQVLEKPATRYHNAGGSCVWKLTSDPFAANVVIERNGEVVGQSFVWTDEAQDIFVFDNIEWANDGDISPYLNIIGVYAKNLPYTNVQIGMGCTQGMNGVGMDCKLSAKLPTTINGTNIYSDYHPQGAYSRARDIKRIDGRSHRPVMVKYPIKEDICTIENAPDEPTKWDVLASKSFNFMLNDFSKSIEDRLNTARQFQENPTVELQRQIFSHCPSAILTIENPDPTLQMEMYTTYPEIAKQIPHPCRDLQIALLEEDPEYLRHMDDVPEDLACGILSRNGLLLDNIPVPTENEIMAALSNNGYAIKYIPEERITEPMKVAAVTTSPRVITLLTDPSEDLQMIAARTDPASITMIDNPCIRAQMSAVNHTPSLVLRDSFREAPECVVRCAIEKDPMLISSFQFKYPGLRSVAIEKNGFAIRHLQGVTRAEYDAAIRQNPDVARLIPPPTGNVILPDNSQDIPDTLEID